MRAEITLDHLRTLADQAGLRLAEEELKRLLAGVNRLRAQASELRDLMSDGLEPAADFAVPRAPKS